MAQRNEPLDSLDNFPTPPWATRALLEQILGFQGLTTKSCLEPACGAGHMAKVLKEYFAIVEACDVHNYGYGKRQNFLDSTYSNDTFEWVITNPPFRLAEEFVFKSLEIASQGVAMLTRTVFLESIGRYERLFSKKPPSIFAQFSERVPMVKGRLDAKASTATGYAWIVWNKEPNIVPGLRWITPCRKSLERMGDYEETFKSSVEKSDSLLKEQEEFKLI